MSDILEPEVLGCYFDRGFSPPLPAMRLRWLSDGFVRPRIWWLPAGLRTVGPAPQCFGIAIHRVSADAYDVCLLWDMTRLFWPALSRELLTNSSLATLLDAMGTNLDYLLDQPIASNGPTIIKTAA